MSEERAEKPVHADRLSSGELAPAGVARRLSEMARSLQAEPSTADLLEAIVEAAVDNIPGSDYAGITLVSARGEITSPARTDGIVEQIDRLQVATRQGPCLSSAWEHRTVRTDDLGTDTRWPDFAARAVRIGVRSVLAVQLFVQDDTLGALNLYSRQPAAFDAESEDLALLLAAHAALAMVGVEREGNLRVALGSRDVIGQAKGILMERHKIGANAAFQLLIRASQENNRKLSAISEMVTSTGQDLTRENIRDF